MGLHAGDPTARVAHAAGVRVAAPDRAGDPRGSHRAPEPTRRPGADQDPSARGARASGEIGVHGLVQSRPRRPRRSGPHDHRRLISSCENGPLDRRVNKREPIVVTMEETMERMFGDPEPWTPTPMPAAPPAPAPAPAPTPKAARPKAKAKARKKAKARPKKAKAKARSKSKKKAKARRRR